MRKLLMATAAVLGASLAVANAATISSGPAAVAPGTSVAGQPDIDIGNQGPPAPAPGQIVVRLDLREIVWVGAGWSTQNNFGNGNKLQPVAIQGYPRIYLGWDGRATNGLQYGLYMEVRTNATNVASTSDFATNSGTTSSTLFFRRNYMYLATPTLGKLKIGETDGPLSFFDLFTIQAPGEGIWDGDAPGLVPGNMQLLYPFGIQSAEYGTAKAIYTSPTFAGFSFAGSYEPNTNTLAGSVCGGGAGVTSLTGCTTQSTSNSGGDLTRRRNTVEVGAHYAGAFGGFGVEAAAVGMFGGRVLPGPFNAGFTGGGLGEPGNPAAVKKFDNLALGMGSIAVSYAGFAVVAQVQGGDVNGVFTLKPAGAPDSVAYGIGVTYGTGPLYVGANLFEWWFQGQPGLPTQRKELGVGAGINYNLAPGLAAFGEYVYGTQKQNGFNFISGSINNPTTTFPNLNSKVQAQAALIGFQFRW